MENFFKKEVEEVNVLDKMHEQAKRKYGEKTAELVKTMAELIALFKTKSETITVENLEKYCDALNELKAIRNLADKAETDK